MTAVYKKSDHVFVLDVSGDNKTGLVLRFRRPNLRDGLPIAARLGYIENSVYPGSPGLLSVLDDNPEHIDVILSQLSEWCEAVADWDLPEKEIRERSNGGALSEYDWEDTEGAAPPGTGSFRTLNLTPESIADGWSIMTAFRIWRSFAALSQLSKKVERQSDPSSLSAATQTASSIANDAKTKPDEPGTADTR
jgi:hypothetical protein